ncbi:aldo/keto reductase [Actomonas aquatica]|uniref:Aldo/keto reductase n=1 Tax=Actomonas aquatica TaxID=2866162 RepID=A0ABZ1C3T1_9BACT|nr:aldo/keto reductase [Opitutus sp. WL0086]WRQ86224.1 aldo/keto reductase [Opitutus sp. WL0086]
MERRRLGRSNLTVTDLCFGTMTFGARNTEEEAFALLDRAYEAGINFYDTAEIYPVPPKAEWVHRTEEIVGRWLQTKPRASIILATKVVGPAHGWFVPPVRHGNAALDRHHIRTAVEGSLRRLQTDYIDLYQTHWPDPDGSYEEILEALTELKEEGLVRIVGSSNESAWGTMKAEAVAAANGFARYETIQNNFSILNRRFEDALAEICRREKISCLPYSPLGGGVCSGKYNDGALPEPARFTEYLKGDGERQKKMSNRFVNERSLNTVTALHELAREAGLNPVAMCLAWSRQHDFVASSIFGATTMEQLEENLGALDLTLSSDVLAKIDAITQRWPYPLG